MVDAYTFTGKGKDAVFASRTELYDHMISVGEAYLEGDIVESFAEHVAVRASERADIPKNDPLARVIEKMNAHTNARVALNKRAAVISSTPKVSFNITEVQ